MLNGMSKIIYFGVAFLPNENAVAIRALSIAEMVKNISCKPVLIGMNNKVEENNFVKSEYEGVTIYEIHYPQTFSEKVRDGFNFFSVIKRIIEDIGILDIKAFLMQDYQYQSMKRIKKYCETNKIDFIPDIMDYFTFTIDKSLYKNIFKSIDTFLRMHFFYPGFKKKICISHTFKKFFKEKGVTVIPPVADKISLLSDQKYRKSENITLIFAGTPGKHFEKEKLDWVIRALSENNSKMGLIILGVEEKMVLKNNPKLKKYMSKNIHFLGRVSHEKCMNMFLYGDFSLIIRKKNKLTNYGLSSKISEAFSFGIPVLATDVSDNQIYVKDGLNGFVCESNYEHVREMIRKVELLSTDKIKQMKEYTLSNNPLLIKNYVDDFSRLFKEE